jgi:hypothetical protein
MPRASAHPPLQGRGTSAAGGEAPASTPNLSHAALPRNSRPHPSANQRSQEYPHEPLHHFVVPLSQGRGRQAPPHFAQPNGSTASTHCLSRKRLLSLLMLDWLSNSPIAWAIGGQSFGVEIRSALIGGFATFGAAIAGFGAVILQMRSQGRQARAAIIETERRKFKANMYEEAVLVCRDVADSAIELSNRLRTMMMHVEIASRAQAAGLNFQVPPTRFPELTASYATFSDAVLRFVFLIENRRFIDERIVVFRTALFTVLHDTSDLIFSQFMAHVLPALPVEAPDGSLFPYNAPSIEGALTVRSLSERFIDALQDSIAYTEDFLVEMQNLLLGDLFGMQLGQRQPLDPDIKVVCLDHAEELEAWFRKETPWGQNIERVETETRARFATPPPKEV